MGIFKIGLGALLEVGGALSRGPRDDRMRLPEDGRARWNRDEQGLFQWNGMPRRTREMGASHGNRSPSRPAA